MKARILDAIQRCKKEIENKALEVRVDEVGAAPPEHQLVLDLQDSFSLMRNVW